MKNNFMKIQMLATLFLLLTSTDGYCAIQSNSESMVVYSNTFSKIVPPRWHISRVADVRSWWQPNKRQIEIDFRKEQTRENMRIRPIDWFDARIIVLEMDYDAALGKVPIPFPLFACTDKYQFYLWGVPASMNWSNSVSQLGNAVRTVFTNAAVVNLSDDDINTYDKARQIGVVNAEYFRQKWFESITALTNSASKTCTGLAPSELTDGHPGADNK